MKLTLSVILITLACAQAHFIPSDKSARCSVSFSAQVEHNAEGAEPFHEIETVAGCSDLCRATPECLAFDYDRNDPPYKNARCWIHTNPSLEVKEQPAVDHYSKGPMSCYSVCEDKFEGQVEHNAEGATPYHEYEDLDDCLDLCRDMPNCLAVDYDRNNPPYKNARCWIHDNPELIVKEQPAVDHYTRKPCTNGPGCFSEFTGHIEHNAEGAYPVHEITTVDECAELCQSLSECIAFDYDRNLPPYKNSRCWIHDNPSIEMKEQPAVDHYTKGQCTFNGACSTPFSVQVEHNAEGATPYHDYEDLDDCLDLCREMPECLAVDYDRNDPPYKNARCWIHDNPNLVVKEQPAVDHHKKGDLICTAACVDDFIGYKETNAEGATPYHEITSVAGCADLCREIADCIAFDYDRNDPPYKNARCWIHDDPTIEMKEQPAVDHYRREPCPYDIGCMGTYSALYEQHVEGAYPVRWIRTVDGCAERCQSLPECLGFDYDRNRPPYKKSRCWIHTDLSPGLEAQPAVDHYRKGKCQSTRKTQCISNFDSAYEHNAEGATPYKKMKTVEACADLCRETSGCVAFDFDRNDPPYKNARCWIHDNPSLEVKEQPAVDHYSRISCPGSSF